MPPFTDPDLTVWAVQFRALRGRPVRKSVSDMRGPLEDRRGIPFESSAALDVEQRQERLHVPDQPVRRTEVRERATVESLHPEAILSTSRPQCVRASSHAVRQRSSSVHSSIVRAAIIVPGVPHMTSSASFEVLARTFEQRIGQLTARASRSATSRIPVSPKTRDDSRSSATSIFMVRSVRKKLEIAKSEVREIGLRVAIPTKLVERPQNSRRAGRTGSSSGSHACQRSQSSARQRRLGRERGIGVLDDLADTRASALVVPRLVGQGLERLRAVEHASTLRKTEVWLKPNPMRLSG